MSIVLTTEIDIDATPAQVWAVLTDFTNYGQWSNFSSIEGRAEVGTTLTMRMPGFRFSSTVAVATVETELRWEAKIITAGLFLGQHSFTLATNPDGTTHLTNSETFSGALVKPFERMFATAHSDNGYAAFNRALKSRVEARSLVRA